ncbi:HEAT repeat domain-containing protein [Amycolatopsis sp. NPDC005232]|uniref:HEAT repeat domain-containing protein n=1 Tax=Amycolatopsis sp. NPDC005232 TaxID=3157027 RepID=UPI0033BBB756
MPDTFETALWMMRRHNPQTREGGFQLLLAEVTEHVEALIAEFERETEDLGLRCWLLELIGEAEAPEALPVLAAQLDSPDESLRSWAIRGLERLNNPEARTVLWRARANGTIT